MTGHAALQEFHRRDDEQCVATPIDLALVKRTVQPSALRNGPLAALN
jgi:hypothetical protein